MSLWLSIYRVSAISRKRLCKRRTQHQKIADIFQSGAKWQKTNVFPIEKTLSIILIHNRMVMSGDVLLPGLRNFAFCFFLCCLQWYEKGQWRGHQITFSAFFFCCQFIANVPFSETQFILYVLNSYEYQNLVIDHCVRQNGRPVSTARSKVLCLSACHAYLAHDTWLNVPYS